MDPSAGKMSRILKELGFIYFLFFLTVLGGYLAFQADEIGSAADWATAVVALMAFLAAVVAILVQSKLARERASIDFFIKTETDKEMLETWDAYREGCEALRGHIQAGGEVAAFANNQASRKHYEAIRNYLNIHELLGNGINREVFDDHVAYHFWSNELQRAINNCGAVIKHAQSTEHARTYVELEKVSQRWSKRDARESGGQFIDRQFGLKLPWGFKVSLHIERDIP